MEVLDYQGLIYYDNKIKDEMTERYEGTIRPMENSDIDKAISDE